MGRNLWQTHGIKAVVEMNRLMDNADLIATLMVEGLNGSMKPFFQEIHQLRPYKGNIFCSQYDL
jgi:histidine ammonia-lyase